MSLRGTFAAHRMLSLSSIGAVETRLKALCPFAAYYFLTMEPR